MAMKSRDTKRTRGNVEKAGNIERKKNKMEIGRERAEEAVNIYLKNRKRTRERW